MSDLVRATRTIRTGAIDYFGGVDTPLVRFKSRVSLRARRAMFDRFMREFAPRRDTTVIDVGVTPDEKLVDSNAFEQFFPTRTASPPRRSRTRRSWRRPTRACGSCRRRARTSRSATASSTSLSPRRSSSTSATTRRRRSSSARSCGWRTRSTSPSPTAGSPGAAHLPAGRPLASQAVAPGDPAPPRQGVLGGGGEPEPRRRGGDALAVPAGGAGAHLPTAAARHDVEHRRVRPVRGDPAAAAAG